MIRYFISDLHLSEERLDLIQAFTQMMEQLVALNEPAELYILGDFYEVWIGDDFQAQWNTDIEAALKKVSQSGIALLFLHGNRDFLLGKAWLQRVGARLLNEQTVLAHHSGRILLSHGDEYCLADVAYQDFRQLVRSQDWQDKFLAMPLAQRAALAAQLRDDSKTMSADKSSNIMDVSTSAVAQSLAQHACNTLIHGHTHRPATHHQKQHLRCVLGDWDKEVWLASIDDKQFRQAKASVSDFIDKGLNGMVQVHRENIL